jgi:hypothetical protein
MYKLLNICIYSSRGGLTEVTAKHEAFQYFFEEIC